MTAETLQFVVRTQSEVARFFGRSIKTIESWRASGMPGTAGAYALDTIAQWRLSERRAGHDAEDDAPRGRRMVQLSPPDAMNLCNRVAEALNALADNAKDLTPVCIEATAKLARQAASDALGCRGTGSPRLYDRLADCVHGAREAVEAAHGRQDPPDAFEAEIERITIGVIWQTAYA